MISVKSLYIDNYFRCEMTVRNASFAQCVLCIIVLVSVRSHPYPVRLLLTYIDSIIILYEYGPLCLSSATDGIFPISLMCLRAFWYVMTKYLYLELYMRNWSKISDLEIIFIRILSYSVS